MRSTCAKPLCRARVRSHCAELLCGAFVDSPCGYPFWIAFFGVAVVCSICAKPLCGALVRGLCVEAFCGALVRSALRSLCPQSLCGALVWIPCAEPLCGALLRSSSTDSYLTNNRSPAVTQALVRTLCFVFVCDSPLPLRVPCQSIREDSYLTTFCWEPV